MMRQQYHFRVINGKTLIWNVNKLVEWSKGLPMREIPLANIKEIDEAFWFKEGDLVTARDFVSHMQLVEATSLDYPIILCHEGKLIDGMHRVVKAILLGYTHIKAVQFVQFIEPDYTDIDLNTLPYED